MTNPKTEMPKTKQMPKEMPKDLQTAYKIHTLAQIIYGQLAATHPWLVPFPASNVFSQPEQWPPTMTAGTPAEAWGLSGPWGP